MPRADLPREVNGQPLGYDQLVSVLDTLEGEPVIVRLTVPAGDSTSESGLASIVGEISHVASRYEGDEFAVGTPYPDDAPRHLGGGVLFINEPEFESATLTTFDGNDYFVILIRTRLAEIHIQDRDSTYP